MGYQHTSFGDAERFSLRQTWADRAYHGMQLLRQGKFYDAICLGYEINHESWMMEGLGIDPNVDEMEVPDRYRVGLFLLASNALSRPCHITVNTPEDGGPLMTVSFRLPDLERQRYWMEKWIPHDRCESEYAVVVARSTEPDNPFGSLELKGKATIFDEISLQTYGPVTGGWVEPMLLRDGMIAADFMVLNENGELRMENR